MESILLVDLLKNASKYTRPSISPEIPTVVTLEFGLRKVRSLVSRRYLNFALYKDDNMRWLTVDLKRLIILSSLPQDEKKQVLTTSGFIVAVSTSTFIVH